MNHLGEGRTDKAIENALACHRFARLVGQGPTLIDQLVAAAIDEIAFQIDQAVLDSHPTEQQLIKMRRAYAKLAPCCDMSNAIAHTERYILLETITLISKNPKKYLNELFGASSLSGKAQALFLKGGIDWNIPLQTGNKQYDRMAQIASLKSFRERNTKARRFELELELMIRKVVNQQPQQFLSKTKKERSEAFGKVTLSFFMPALASALGAQDRTNSYQALTEAAIEIELYRAKNGNYPKSLDPLGRAVLKDLPNDLFTEKPFYYERRGNGYLLYSLGPNQKNNDGSSISGNLWKGEHNKKDIEIDKSGKPIDFDFDIHDDYGIRLPLLPLKLPK